MKKRYIWLTAIAVVIVLIVVGTFVYASRFANTVSQTHTAAGAIIVSPTATGDAATGTATGTSSASASLQTFQIVPAQTTAAYSVFE
ncbi:MAG TPA: hypothetical protein VII61_02605, partial [Ktedonobacteraceae bacterium]